MFKKYIVPIYKVKNYNYNTNDRIIFTTLFNIKLYNDPKIKYKKCLLCLKLNLLFNKKCINCNNIFVL